MNVKNKLLKKIKGFTLVEIMIVVTIIGILASLAVPAFQRARWKALETSVRNNLRQIWGAAQQYMLENGVDEVKLADIVIWQKKDGTLVPAEGTNPGYTSVIKQIAGEDYDAISVYEYTETFNDTNGEKTTAGTAAITDSTFKPNTIGLQVTDSGSGNFIKLRV